MIYRFKLDFPLFPKPRGNLGQTKKGKTYLYHSTSEYTKFKREVKKVAKKACLPGRNSWKYPIGISVVESFIPRNPESDMDNCLGGLLDALVQGSFLRDDSRRYLQSIQFRAIESDRNFSTILIYPISECDVACLQFDRLISDIRDYNLRRLFVDRYS